MTAVPTNVRIVALALVIASYLGAADEVQLALVLKAQTDFNRVDLSATPRLPDTSACVASQAALLPIASPTDLPLVHYRKGYCTLAGATITHTPALFADAAAEFRKSIEAWPGRVALQPKKTVPEPPSAAVPILAAIARLQMAPGDSAVAASAREQIAAALAAPTCPVSVMPAAQCQADLQLGRKWVAWIALSDNKLSEAAQNFSPFPDSGWPDWVAGRQAFETGKYRDAAAGYRKAIDDWQRAYVDRLAPQPDMGLALTDLGGALLLSGDPAGAITTLDQAIKTDPAHARTFFYRARARELAGNGDAALADYALASRTAFAATRDLASGEAHLYRGIAAYRRKDFARAEDEFANSLNFAIPDSLRADAVGWRHLAAVAAGSCGASQELLSGDLRSVSPFFPKAEADALIAACRKTASVR
jgi:tetratricopeptide (TPR) repeat protein